MIFRSLVILCALSACAASNESALSAAANPAPSAEPQAEERKVEAPNAESDLKRARSLIKLGQNKGALQILAKWESVPDAPAEILYALGRLKASSNQLVKATELYARAIKLHPNRSWRIELAAIYDFAGKPESAISLYQALLNEKDEPDLRRELGLTFLMAQRPTEAVEELQKALVSKPSLDTRAELSLALCKAQRYQKADTTLREGVQATVEGTYAPAVLGEILQCLGDAAAALDLVKELKSRVEPALYQRLIEALSKQAHSGQGS